MSKEEFRQLNIGDVVINNAEDITYQVVAVFGDRVTLIRMAEVTGPCGWEVLSKVSRRVRK